MGRPQPVQWVQALFLSLPLVAICAWIAAGVLRSSHSSSVATRDTLSAALASPPPPVQVPGLPPAEADLPADRLEERVDGAAEHLRQIGCRRLIAWKLDSPPAELEVYVFGGLEGARAQLAREAGPHTDPTPGDEASVTAQAILFRRGVFYAKLIADPSAPADPEPLMAVAANLDQALAGATGARLLSDPEPSRP